MAAAAACSVATAIPPPSTSFSSLKLPSLSFSPQILTSWKWNPHQNPQTRPITAAFLGIGLALVSASSAFPEGASAAEIPILALLQEPDNALSLPTWAIHVSSVVEWITAMVLVWEYGERSGYESWKGLSWGMVPLLGGAFCACTWHFFYNSESLEVLVALQGALTVIGNLTMCIAAYRIYKSSQEGSKNR